jgi:hypothetical protein
LGEAMGTISYPFSCFILKATCRTVAVLPTPEPPVTVTN